MSLFSGNWWPGFAGGFASGLIFMWAVCMHSRRLDRKR